MSRPPKHPEDAIGDGEAIVKAAARFAKWKARRALAIDALVLTHSDEDAEQLLAVLREEFWTL
jgi:glyoxylase-like metal-dependent hydrolase (beta-lactamase superfamily II)